MANFFYFDTNGNKRGPYDHQQLKERVANGIIEPQTPMETDDGHKGLAGQLPGLFPATLPPTPSANPFCTNCGNSVDEKAVACMSCGARPTGHKKFCRQCGVGLNPEQVVCIKCGTALTGNLGASATVAATATMANVKPTFQATADTFPDDSGTGEATMANDAIASIKSAFDTKGVLLDTLQKKRIHYWTTNCIGFYVVGYAVLSLLSIALVVAASLDDLSVSAVEARLRLADILDRCALYSVAIYLVCFCIFLYRLWEAIPREFARTTPWKAVLLMLVPFFNVYWLFVVFLGLYKDMNKATESYGLGRRFNETLILVVCVLWCILMLFSTAVAVLMLVQLWEWWWIPTTDDVSLIVDEAVLTTGEIVLEAGLLILFTIVAVTPYWIIRNNVLEFMDIKASVGK